MIRLLAHYILSFLVVGATSTVISAMLDRPGLSAEEVALLAFIAIYINNESNKK